MRKSIYPIEFAFYVLLGFVFGIVMVLDGAPIHFLLLAPMVSLFCYIGYLVSIKILAGYPPQSRIPGAIAVVVLTGGAWLVFFIPGEIIRRLALRFYRGEKPVETVFGPVATEEESVAQTEPKPEGDILSDRQCPSCGKLLRRVQVEAMIGNPDYQPWCREGYCSLECYEKTKAEQED